jgi:hypothetical protein
VNCHELKNFVENSLPRERDAALLRAAQQHALICPACAKEMAEMFRLEEELAGLAGIDLESDLSEKIMHRIGNLRGSQRPFAVRREWRTFMVIAAGLLVLAAAYWYEVDWSNWSTSFTHLLIDGSRNPLSIRGGLDLQIQLLLPTLVGAALIVIGLTWELDRPANEAERSADIY